MVKKGDFSVVLVDAETKQPFLEHYGPDGEAYVEAEPGGEYFIRICTDSEDPVKAKIKVDGEDLGYEYICCNNDPPGDEGLWSYRNGREDNTALKFSKTAVRDTSPMMSSPVARTGTVDVTFYEATESGYRIEPDCSSSWKGGDLVIRMTDPDRAKRVKSDKGTIHEVTLVKRRRVDYENGDLLERITVRYCTVLGLIESGILPQPPLWEHHRMLHPWNPEEAGPFTSRELKVVAVRQTVGGIEQEVQVEAFDLTDE